MMRVTYNCLNCHVKFFDHSNDLIFDKHIILVNRENRRNVSRITYGRLQCNKCNEIVAFDLNRSKVEFGKNKLIRIEYIVVNL